jgi:hypothetical protein
MRAVGDLPLDSSREFNDWISDNWWPILVVGAVAVVALATTIQFALDPFYVNKDSALFQHGGWYMGQGATLYVDIWDLKPPLIFWLSGILAFFSFGNMALLHVYGVLAAVTAVVGGLVFVGLTTHRLTDDGFASVTAAASMLVLTSVYTFPYAGIRPKYFAFLCGAAALYFAVEDRHLLSGVVAALATGFWHLAGPLAFLVVGMALQREGVRAAGRTIAGGVAVAVLTVLPFVLTGTVIPLFVEVVLAPIYGVERYTLLSRSLTTLVELGPSVLLVPVAAIGWVWGVRENWREYWWVATGGTLYFCQVFLEFQGAIELVLLFLFVALGVGLLVAELSAPSRRSLVAGCLVVLVLTTMYWNQGPGTPVKDEVEDLKDEHNIPNYEALPPDPPASPSMQTIYWEKLKPGLCHYRLGHKQKYFEMTTGGTLYKSECGQWPYEQDPFPWLVDSLLPFATTPAGT